MKKTLLLLLLSLNLGLLAQVPQSEKDALIALYNATDGPNWYRHNNWNTSQPLASWDGINTQTINGVEHVTEIYLYNNNLSGQLPTEIGNLTKLTYLSLSGNQLTGSIPTEIGNLTELTYLSLSGNQLTGSIPTEIGNLTNLITLSFSGNQLSGLVPDLTSLTALKGLYIYNNNFQFVDFENQFVTLQNIIQNNNGWFSYIPMNKIDTEDGYDIVIGNNYTFTMSPVSGTGVTYQWYKNDDPIQGATGLTYSITNAQLSDAANYTCKASSAIITDLTIDRNLIHIYAPCLQSDKDALIALYNATNGANWTNNDNWLNNNPVYTWYGVEMAGNRVIGIDLSEWGQGNNLIGTLPPEIGDLTELKKLDLSFNTPNYSVGGDLHGNIPSEIGNLTKLEELNLDFTNFTGNIPPELGNCVALKDLDIWDSDLSGNIPTELGNLVNLEGMTLEDNNLTGDIPPSFANCTKMKSFWLNGNQLSGDVSNLFVNMPDLYYVSLGAFWDIQHQAITGNIDFSNNPNIHGIWIEDTDISTIDLRNGNNQIMINSYFRADQNPNLTCIFVDDANYSTQNWTYIDANTHFVETQAECDAFTSERNALIALYNATDGTNWNRNDNWNTSQPLSSWEGVTTQTINGVEHVTKIYLSNNNLSGQLPDEIGDLTELKILYLDNNNLTGTIPITCNQLDKLERFYIYSNHLSDTLPDLTGMDVIKYFHISNNDFDFDDLEPNLYAIKDHVVNDNNGYFGYTFQNKRDNEIIYNFTAGNNYTFTMSPVAGTNVTYQWYKNDEPIQGATSNVYNLNNTQFSDAANYYCKAISPILDDVDIRRKTIHIYAPCVQSDIDALTAFYNATNGANWTNNDNWLSNNPVYTWHGVKMEGNRVSEISFISSNNLNGQISPEIGNLTGLKYLIIGRNNSSYGGSLHGNIPSEIGNLTNLKTLYLSRNELTGNIPTELGNLNNLKYLYLRSNQLTGNIPTELGNLTNLEYLDLSRNELTGNIPTELGNLNNLKFLYLYLNQLTGNIPTELSNLTNLEALSLSSNQLTGNIPIELGNLTNLEYLNLSSNELTGNIPTELSNLNNLKSLSLSSNQLTGNIPTELGNLNNLEWLYLSSNQLTGNIPTELSNLTNLEDLFLYSNQLTGDIPDIFVNMPNLYFVSIGNNPLTGNVNLSQNSNLGYQVDLSDMQISSIDIRNGNNSNINHFNAQNNPNLTCIFVDDANYSTQNWTNIDANTHFVETQAECDALGVDDIDFTNNINVFPNPTNKILNIENPNNYKIKQAKIYNLQGQQILKFNDNLEHLDVSNLPKGMYILELQTEEKENKARFKFIKE